MVMLKKPYSTARLMPFLPAFLCLSLGMQSAFGQWVKTYSLPEVPIYSMAVAGNHIFAGTFYGVYRSSDYGADWEPANNGMTTSQIRAMTAEGNKILAGTQDGGVYLSTDYGSSWKMLDSGIPPSISVYGMAANGPNMFIGGTGLFASTDSAASWASAGEGMGGLIVLALASSGFNTYAGTYNAGLFLSEDNGKAWASANVGMPESTQVNAILLTPGPMYVGTGTGVFVSQDSAKHWQEADQGATHPTGITCLAYTGNLVFAGTDGNGVYMTSNHGEAWSELNDGLGVGQVFALAADDKYLYAAKPGIGIYRHPIAELTAGLRMGENPGAEIGFDKDLETGLRTGAGIGFSTQAQGAVDLSLYDAKGNKSVTLIHSELAAGKHRAGFNARGMSTGIYFLRLQAAGKSAIRRILLGG